MSVRLLSINIPKCATVYTHQTLEGVLPHHHWFDTNSGTPRGRFRPIDFNRKGIFTFAFVRNPFDWLTSMYAYLGTNPGTIEDYLGHIPFQAFLETVATRLASWPSKKFLFWQIFDREGFNFMDYMGRVETIDDDLNKIAKLNGVEYKKKKPVNVTLNRKPYKEYYTEDDFKLVEDVYKRELEVFGYDRNGMTKKSLFDYPTGKKAMLYYEIYHDKLIVGQKVARRKERQVYCDHIWELQDTYMIDVNKQWKEVPFHYQCKFCNIVIEAKDL